MGLFWGAALGACIRGVVKLDRDKPHGRAGACDVLSGGRMV
jgi:hypothetical protein